MENILHKAAESVRCNGKADKHSCQLKQASLGTESGALL